MIWEVREPCTTPIDPSCLGADPGFPVRRDAVPRGRGGGGCNMNLPNFPKKSHESEKNFFLAFVALSLVIEVLLCFRISSWMTKTWRWP